MTTVNGNFYVYIFIHKIILFLLAFTNFFSLSYNTGFSNIKSLIKVFLKIYIHNAGSMCQMVLQINN